MRVSPGDQIPFWLKIANSNPTRYVVAHLTSLSGVEQVGSPYLLTYSGNRGIYTGLGPVMGPNNLVADYEVYMDEDLLVLDRTQLPNVELIESDISNRSVVTIILGSLSGISPDTITGVIDLTPIIGVVSLSSEMQANISTGSEQQGEVVTITQTGTIETTTIEGV